MTPDDLDAVVQLERATFADPWPRASFLQDIYRAESLALVAVADSRIVGYSICWADAGPNPELHVANIAVEPTERHKCVGTKLLKVMLNFGRERSAATAYLEVRRSNTGAQDFYRSHGFVQTGTRAGYYHGVEDALIMERDMAQPESRPG